LKTDHAAPRLDDVAAAMGPCDEAGLWHCSAHGLRKSGRDYCRGGYITAENGTPGRMGDYTAIVAFGVDPQGDIFVLDL
jgi:hypothetical protein